MTCPLADADPEIPYVVERVEGSIRGELYSLGLVPGTVVQVLRRSRGHVLVAVDEARYSLGTEVARFVHVGRC